LVGFGATSAAGHKYVLTVVEARSGFVWLFPLRSKEASEVAGCLYLVLLEVGALVRELVSDQGKEFVAQVVQDLCTLFKARKIDTSAYHPQSNGVAERMNDRIATALTAWVDKRQTNWHLGLETVQFALRTTPREETGMTPFFCAYGREASLPHDAFMTEGRDMDLHAEVERRIELMGLASEVVGAAFDKRAERVERRNAEVARGITVAVGDLVMIRHQGVEGRARKLDPKYIGPWVVVEKAGPSGLAFSCRMFGRRVRHTTAHVTNMKPFKLRPAHLEGRGKVAPVTAAQLEGLPRDAWLDRLMDRRANPNGSWDYRWQRRDGALSGWESEDRVLELTTPWTLDTFHALYELRHQGAMPEYAKRLVAREDRQLSKEEALSLPRGVPRGTVLVREHREAAGGPLTYVWGTVQGYLSPYWRVRYEDNLWEDMTRRQVQAAAALGEAVRNRARQGGAGAPVGSRPRLMVSMSPTVPANFGPDFVGETLRYKFGTGWCRGRLVAFLPKSRVGDAYVVKVQFNGKPEGAVDTVRLKPSCYEAAATRADAERCAINSWNILLVSVAGDNPEQGVAARSPEQGAAEGSPARAAQRARSDVEDSMERGVEG
jgi:hypothetical protein